MALNINKLEVCNFLSLRYSEKKSGWGLNAEIFVIQTNKVTTIRGDKLSKFTGMKVLNFSSC